MTSALKLKNPQDSKDAASEETVDQLEQSEPPATARAMPGLATRPVAAKDGDLDFETFTSEMFGWYADVKKAMPEHKRCLDLIDTTVTNIEQLSLPDAKRQPFIDDLTRLRGELTALTAKGKVSTANRAAAVQLVSVAAAKIEKIDKQANEALAAKLAEDEKIKQAAAKKRREDAAAKAAEDEKIKQEDERKKKIEEEQRQQAETQSKAADKQKQQKEAAETNAAELAQKKREKQAAEQDEKRKKEEAERLALEAKQEKARLAEQADQHRAATYGDKTASHGAAQGVAETIAHGEYEQQIAPAEAERKKVIGGLSKTKVKNGTSPEAIAADNAFTKADDAAQEQKATRKGQLEDQLSLVATSASGKALGDADLAWVLGACNGKSDYAQTLADIAAQGGIAAAKAVGKQADAQTIAPVCLGLLQSNVAPEFLVRTAHLLALGTGAFATWLRGLAPADLADGLYFAEANKTALAMVAKVVPVLGTDSDAQEFINAMRATKTKPDDLDWLLGLEKVAGFDSLVRVVKKFTLNLTKVRAIHAGAGVNFDLSEIASICDSFPKRLDDLPTVLAEADAHSVSFVGLWYSIGGGSAPSELLQVALRAEALLTDAPRCPAFTITVEKPDQAYGRHGAHAAECATNDTRTGFLYLNFPGNVQSKLHTHWNAATENVSKISSMHVQERVGNNGTELNKWYKFFPELTAAAVAAHNAGAPKPTGGDVSL